MPFTRGIKVDPVCNIHKGKEVKETQPLPFNPLLSIKPLINHFMISWFLEKACMKSATYTADILMSSFVEGRERQLNLIIFHKDVKYGN